MSATMAILTIGVVPISEVLPLLTEHIREDQITHITLLGKMSRAEVVAEYGAEPGEERLLVLLNDNQFVEVSRQKVEQSLQAVIEVLDNQSYDVILLLNTFKLSGMTARNAILLEPPRIIPPLVASIVEGHQVGVLVPIEAILDAQQPGFEYEGEMAPDAALNPTVMKNYPFSRLSAPANVLVMPGLQSANISAKLLRELAGNATIGPMLIGMEKPVQIAPMTAIAPDVLTLAVLAAAGVAG